MTINVVYGVALVLPHDGSLHFGVVAAACAGTLFANYFGVVKSARYPAFRTRLDRQPFAVKFGVVLFSAASSVAVTPGFIWLTQRYYRPAQAPCAVANRRGCVRKNGGLNGV